MKKIERINKILEEYKKECQKFSIIEDSLSIEKILKGVESLRFQKNYPTCQISSMSKEYTLILMKQFLDRYAREFLPFFEELLKNRCIIWYKSKTSIHRAGYRNQTPFIKLILTNTLQDFIALVHEFFHLTNRKFEEASYQITRETLSEFISIYFEKKALIFLKEKGYPDKEIAYMKTKRIKDTHHTIMRYYYERKIWRVYAENKALTSKNAPYKIEKINKYFEKYTFSPFKKMVYILGDMLSEYIISKNIEVDIILNLNASLNELSIFMAFDILKITLTSTKIKEIINTYQNHVDEMIATFS